MFHQKQFDRTADRLLHKKLNLYESDNKRSLAIFRQVDTGMATDHSHAGNESERKKFNII